MCIYKCMCFFRRNPPLYFPDTGSGWGMRHNAEDGGWGICHHAKMVGGVCVTIMKMVSERRCSDGGQFRSTPSSSVT